jgi:hypothetical protein
VRIVASGTKPHLLGALHRLDVAVQALVGEARTHDLHHLVGVVLTHRAITGKLSAGAVATLAEPVVDGRNGESFSQAAGRAPAGTASSCIGQVLEAFPRKWDGLPVDTPPVIRAVGIGDGLFAVGFIEA